METTYKKGMDKVLAMRTRDYFIYKLANTKHSKEAKPHWPHVILGLFGPAWTRVSTAKSWRVTILLSENENG